MTTATHYLYINTAHLFAYGLVQKLVHITRWRRRRIVVAAVFAQFVAPKEGSHRVPNRPPTIRPTCAEVLEFGGPDETAGSDADAWGGSCLVYVMNICESMGELI